MLNKKIYFLLLMYVQCGFAGEAPEFLKAFYNDVNPVNMHVGLQRTGVSDKQHLDIVLYNQTAQNNNKDDEHFKNMMIYFKNASFKLVAQEKGYNLCVNDYVIACIKKKHINAGMNVFFGYLMDGEQLQNYRKQHHPGLKEEIESIVLLFTANSAVCCEDIIKLCPQMVADRNKGFNPLNNMTSCDADYDSFIDTIKDTNHNLLSVENQQKNKTKENPGNVQSNIKDNNSFYMWLIGGGIFVFMAAIVLINKYK